MKRILKIFVTGDEQVSLPGIDRVLERYDGFVLVEASDAAAQELSQSHILEDITHRKPD